MRSLALYSFSKNYAKKFIGIDGVLLTEPEEFFPAAKKELLKKTGNVKTNMMRAIKELFPTEVNPFVGGLGNRENDAIAYLAAGIPEKKIFIGDKQSEVHQLDETKPTTYKQMCEDIDEHFPPLKKQKLKISLKSSTRWHSECSSVFSLKNSSSLKEE